MDLMSCFVWMYSKILIMNILLTIAVHLGLRSSRSNVLLKTLCASTLLKTPAHATYTWKINNFSKIGTEFCCSESFTVGGKQWLLKVYPKGVKRDSNGDGNGFLSIFLVLNEPEMSDNEYYAEFTLRVKDQLSTLRNLNVTGDKIFNDLEDSWGLRDFMTLKDLKDTTEGYYVNDTVIIECKISFLVEFKHLEEWRVICDC